MACDEDLSLLGESKYQNAPGMLTVLFKADFSAWDKSDPTDATCGGYPDCLLTMEGYGEITHLEDITPITTRMTVCCNVETGLYHNMSGSFVIHGDELYYRIHIGQIIPYDEDGSSHYQKESKDQLIFTGGTGV